MRAFVDASFGVVESGVRAQVRAVAAVACAPVVVVASVRAEGVVRAILFLAGASVHEVAHTAVGVVRAYAVGEGDAVAHGREVAVV